MAGQQITVTVWLNADEVAELDRQIAAHHKWEAQEYAEPQEWSREEWLAVQITQGLQDGRSRRWFAWREGQRRLEQLLKQHGFTMSKDTQIEREA